MMPDPLSDLPRATLGPPDAQASPVRRSRRAVIDEHARCFQNRSPNQMVVAMLGPSAQPKLAMPTVETLERLIALVERNAHVEAIEAFYAPNASMQENQSPPRVGRDNHMANERRVLAKAKALSSTCIRPVFVNGDNVVIRWVFRFEWLDGTVTRMEELAYQRWHDERVVEETFFYDPAQLVPKAAQA